jgi:hypothetical protein
MLLAMLVAGAFAQDWSNLATVSMTNATTPKLTSRYVCYTDGRDIRCDNPSLYVSTGGLIGINTNNPNAQLDVYGTVSATNFVGDGSGLTGVTAGATDRIVSGSTGGTRMVAISQTGYISVSQAGANTAWLDPTRGLVTLGVSATGPISGTAGYFTSRVGIGAAPTSDRLYLRLANNNNLRFYENSTVATLAAMNNAENAYTPFQVNAQQFIINTNGSERGRFAADGNFGIGLTNPQISLTVIGEVQVSNSGVACGANTRGAIRYQGTSLQYCNATTWTTLGAAGGGQEDRIVSGTSNAIAWQDRSVTISTAGAQRIVVGEDGRVTISASAASAQLAVSGVSASNVHRAINLQSADGNSAGFLGTSGDAGASNRVVIFSNRGGAGSGIELRSNWGFAYVNPYGSLGLGTLFPTATLQVSGTFMVSTSTQGDTSPSLHVAENGNVGIGIANSTHALQIARSSPNLHLFDTDTGVGHTFSGDSSFGAFFINVDTGNKFQNSALIIRNAGTNLVTVSKTGLVGIGTTNPLAKLDVVGTISASNAIQVGTSTLTCGAGIAGALRYNGGNIQYCNGSTWGSLVGAADAMGDRIVSGTTNAIAWEDRSLTISTAGAQRMIVGENGNVGIGIAAPTARLHVDGGSILVSASTFDAFVHERDGSYGYFGLGSNGNLYVRAPGLAQSLKFRAGADDVDHVTIRPGGSVGVGISLPSARLQVSGSFIVSTSVQTTTPSLYVGTNGRVGFGTASPGTTLEITGGGPNGLNLAMDSITNHYSQRLIFSNGSPGSSVFMFNSSGNLEFYTSGTVASSSGNRRMTLTQAGSLGIGTVSPGSSLTVVGEAQVGSSGAACVTATNAGAIRYSAGTLYYCNASNTWAALGTTGGTALGDRIVSGTTNAIAWEDSSFTVTTNGSQRLIVTKTGRVGIGTATPNAALQVRGGLIISTTAQETTPSLHVLSGGGLGVGKMADTHKLDVRGMIRAVSTTGDVPTSGVGVEIGYDGGVGRGHFYAYDRDNSQWRDLLLGPNEGAGRGLTITSQSHVGVGTFTPLATLTVSGTISSTDAIQVGTSTLSCGAGIAGALRYNGGDIQYCNGSAWGSLVGAADAMDDRIVSGTTNAIAWQDRSLTITTAGVQRVVIGENGNVGLGTNTPLSALDVRGQGEIRVSGSSAGLVMYDRTVGTRRTVLYRSGDKTHLWDTDSGNFRVSLDNATGNLGVGTVSPTATLQVSGSFTVSTSAQGNASPSLFVATTGNVMLGTTSLTSAKLTVEETTANPQLVLSNGPGRTWGVRVGASGAMHFWDDGVERIRFDTTGNVGVSTTSPLAKLDVNGTISASDAIQVGTSTLTCGVGIPGAIRYQGTSLQYCNGTSWTSLGASGGGLADRITSGTLAMVANSATSYISLSTNGTTWGYFNSGGSYLPRLGVGMGANSNYALSVSGSAVISGTTMANLTIEGGSVSGWPVMLGLNNVGTGGTSWQMIAGNNGTGTLGSNFGLAEGSDYRFIVAKGGNIGISNLTPLARLDVGGTISASDAIQVGRSTLTCSSAISGSLRYSTVSSTMEYCNSTAWVSMGPSSTQPISFKATNGSAQSFSTNTNTKLNFATEEFDTNSNFSSSRFTATVPGKYLFSASALLQGVTGGADIYIFKNGAYSGIGSAINGNVTKSGLSTSGILDLAVNDYVEVYAWVGSGSPSFYQSYNQFSGVLLSPQGSGGGGANTLNELTDVNTSGVTTGSILSYDGSSWVISSSAAAGVAALASLTDVQITNIAGRDYLRYDSVAGKWVNISESAVMSTTTMVANWPDAIVCNVTNPSYGPTVFYPIFLPLTSDGLYYYRANQETGTYRSLKFSSSGAFASYDNLTTTDCNASISSLYASGRAFNFIGNAATGSTALGDRITSGTLAMVANSATSYISLSTTGTTWGYLSNGASYLPNLRSNNISGSVIQVGNTGASCTSGISGSIRYSSVSSTMEYCNSTAWVSMGPSNTVPISFRVHKNGTNQTVAQNSYVLVTWSTEEFDTNNNFSGNRFTPTVPGKYLFNAGAYCMSVEGCAVYIYKNGSAVSGNSVGPSSTSNAAAQASTVINMNGTGDYVEVYVYLRNGTTLDGNISFTNFSGALLGPQGGAGGGASVLSELTDVDASGAATGSILAFNGSNWVVSNSSAAGLSALASLTDVSATSPLNNQILRYSASQSKWEAVSASDAVFSCPSGYALVSAAGRAYGCIKTTETAANTCAAHINTCMAEGARLPTLTEFKMAQAQYGYTVSNYAYLENSAGDNDCAGITSAGRPYGIGDTGNYPARCFIPAVGIISSTGNALGDRITSGTTSVIASQDQSVTFSTAGVERMWLGANGGLSIGVSSSVRGLLVAGADEGFLQIYGGASGNNQSLYIRTSPTANYVHMDVGGSGHSNDRIHFGDLVTAGNHITTLGRIGIGMAETPSASLHVSGTISATNAIQLGQDTIACIAAVSGSIRYNTISNTIQFCNGTGWTSLASGTTGGGATALSGLTDVNLTNLAGRDYLRYDANTSRWVNISESTVMSTTTMLSDWPDAIVCGYSSMVTDPLVLYLGHQNYTSGRKYYYFPAGSAYAIFDSDGTYNSGSNLATTGSNPCTAGTTITSLYAAGRAFNFIGNAATSGGALGDRITSGTLAMVANSATSYVSLSTAGTTWGYLNSGNSYLPRLSVAHGGYVRAGTSAYFNGVNNGYAHMAFNAYHDGSTWVIPEPSFKSTLMQMTQENIYFFNTPSAGSTSFEPLMSISGSLVGIGTVFPAAKLDVKGSVSATGAIQVGTTSASCTSGISGTVRYSSSTNVMEYCNSTAWISMGPSATSPVSFHAQRTSNQTVTAATPTKILFNNEVFDTNNNYDTGNGRFTATVPGKYIFSASVDCNTSTNNYCNLAIHKNGGGYAGVQGPYGSNILGTAVTGIMDLGIGDYVEVYVTQKDTTVRGIAQQVFFAGIMVSSGGSGGGGASILNDLTDVDTSGAATGSILAFNGSNWVVSNTGGGNALGDRITSGTTSAIAAQDQSLTISTAGTQRVTIGANGGVGIGTATPGKPLDVVKSPLGSDILRMRDLDGADFSNLSLGINSSGLSFIQSAKGGTGSILPLILYVGANRAINISPTGFVGISRTNPLANLDVAGTISASDAVQVGSSTLTCGASIAGAIRYNANKLQFCNGVAWTSLLNEGISGTIVAYGSVAADGTCVSCNGATITKGGTGVYTVNFVTAQPNTSYTVQLTNTGAASNNRLANYKNLAAGGFDVQVRNVGDTAVNQDFSFLVVNQQDVGGGGGGGGGGTPAGSSGDIQFNNGTAFEADTGQLYWDASGNRLGIGTGTPSTSLYVSGQIGGGFGAMATSGVLDFDDISNARPGSGYTLLRGSTASNAPNTTTNYWHPFSFEYSTKVGSGNMTQFAIPYTAPSGMYLRTRTSGVWTGWYKFVIEDNSGNATITNNLSYGGVLTDLSDRRLKEQIKAIPSSLEEVLRLKPVSFRMKGNSDLETGFIAQDVEKVMPWLVKTAGDISGTKSLNYVGLIAPTIRAVQELKADNDNLRKEMKAANDNVEALRGTVEAMRQELRVLKQAQSQ